MDSEIRVGQVININDDELEGYGYTGECTVKQILQDFIAVDKINLNYLRSINQSADDQATWVLLEFPKEMVVQCNPLSITIKTDIPKATKLPLCKGTLASLAGHQSTRIVDHQHYEYESANGFTNSVTVGLLESAGGTYIGFVATKGYSIPAPQFNKSLKLCELHPYDFKIIDADQYLPAYFNALAKSVNEHANSFTIEIPQSLNCRLLNLQKSDATHQFYYKNKVHYLQSLDDMKEFIVKEFPIMKIVEHMEDEDGRDMLIIRNSKVDTIFDFLTFYHSDFNRGIFNCYYEDGGSVKPFIKLLNTIGMEATE